MNCADVIEHLDRIIFEEFPTDDGLMQHLAACAFCRQAIIDAVKAREVMHLARRLEPVLSNPDEITKNIMFAIQHYPKRTTPVSRYLQRLLAAASVTLFILFAYEQYGVLKKVSALEIRLAETSTGFRYTDLHRLAFTYDINSAGISFTEIGRLISTMDGKTPLSFSPWKKQKDQRKIK